MRDTVAIRFTAVVALVLFVQAQLILLMSAGAIEDGWGVEAGNVQAVALIGTAAVAVLTVLWVILKEDPAEVIPQD
ncbi:MAG: hypothetical protein ABW004_06015 [Aeromicrobium sp.]